MDDWRSGQGGSCDTEDDTEIPEPEHLAENQERADRFLQSVVIPAMERAAQALNKVGRRTSLVTGHNLAGMIVLYHGQEEFQYVIQVTVTPPIVYAAPSMVLFDPKSGEGHETGGVLREGPQDYDVDTISKEEIIRHFLGEYKRQVP